MTEPEDDLLERVAALEREQIEARPPQWAALSRGEVDADAVEDERAREVFKPLSSDFEATLVDTLTASAQKPAEPARVIPFPAIIGAVLAIAAALALWIARGPSGPPMPAHEAWIEAEAQVRGPKPVTITLTMGAPFALYLRPNESVDEEVTAWLCLRQGEHAELLPSNRSAHADVVELSATVPASIEPGAWVVEGFVVAASAGIEPACDVEGEHVATTHTPVEVAIAP